MSAAAVGATPARRWLKHGIGAVVTLLCVIVLLKRVDLAQVLDALAHFHWPYAALAIGSLACGYGLRIARWSMMLAAAGARVGFRACAAPFLGSIALNNVLPLRIGDVVRATVFPQAMGISRSIATSSLIVERLIDLMTLLACLAIGMLSIARFDVPPAIARSAATLAAAGGASLVLGILFSGALGRLFARRAAATGSAAMGSSVLRRGYAVLARVLHGLEAMSRPRPLLAVLAVSMLIWAGESGLFYFVLLGFGIPASPAIALMVMAVATLSTLVPSSPGYVGPFHLAAYTAISLLGGSAAEAGSYAVLVHLALWLPTTFAGALAIWVQPAIFRSARAQAQ